MNNAGIILILIVTLAYLSNYLNWKFLNNSITHFLYFIGTFVHETSHAILCILTGAKIDKFKVFSDEPQVVHKRSKIPFFGELLISFAPVVGGVIFLYVINRYVMQGYFTLPQITNWHDILSSPLKLFPQLNLIQWQSWVMILLFFNVGAMIGPSIQDLKNIWIFIILSFFIHNPVLINFLLLVLCMIFINITLQAVTIAIIFIFKQFSKLP